MQRVDVSSLSRPNGTLSANEVRAYLWIDECAGVVVRVSIRGPKKTECVQCFVAQGFDGKEEK